MMLGIPLLMVLVVLLAKRGRRRARMVWIPFTASISLSTLASAAAIKGTILTFGEDFFWVGMKATWAIRGNTAGEVPIAIGFCHGDLSVTEIVEWADASVSDPDDIIANERSRRPARKVGTFGGAGGDQDISDGDMILTRFKRSVGDGHDASLWAINNSGATLTTGAVVLVDGWIYGRWQR